MTIKTNVVLRWFLKLLFSPQLSNAKIHTVKNGLDTQITIDSEDYYIYTIISQIEKGVES